MKNFARVMGLLFVSSGAHTYPKSGQVASSPLLESFNYSFSRHGPKGK